MADLDDLKLTQTELEEEERRRRQGRKTLDQEIAEKYDVRRLKKVIVGSAGRGERLDLATRSQMERMLGQDFSNVRVFRGPFAEEITARHGADAVTVANTGMVLVRQSPRSAPGTRSFNALLAHELTHVAQAQRGMHFAMQDGSGDGEHEEEAKHVEANAQTMDPDSIGSDKDGTQQGGAENEKAKREHRRRKVLERALELLWERRRIHYERMGRGHGF